jgi:hypothetical protein
MTPEARRARSYAAKAMIEDATLQDGWQQIETEMREQWEACLWPRKRDRIWAELKHVRALRGKLASFAAQTRD